MLLSNCREYHQNNSTNIDLQPYALQAHENMAQLLKIYSDTTDQNI